MKQFNYQTGKLGEEIGRQFLQKKGYQILQSNFQTRFGEIDLIASKNQRLIFVEIKLKIGQQWGRPEEMINKNKILQIQKTALSFLQNNPQLAQKNPLYQIDAICIVCNQDGRPTIINHYENIGDELA